MSRKPYEIFLVWLLIWFQNFQHFEQLIKQCRLNLQGVFAFPYWPWMQIPWEVHHGWEFWRHNRYHQSISEELSFCYFLECWGTSAYEPSHYNIYDLARLGRGFSLQGTSWWWWWRLPYHMDLGLGFLAGKWGDLGRLPFGRHGRALVSFFLISLAPFPFPIYIFLCSFISRFFCLTWVSFHKFLESSPLD